MADLTGSLSTPMQGRETIAPARPAPSILGSLADAGSSIFSAFTAADATSSRRATQARENAAAARKAGEENVDNQLAKASLDVYAPQNADTSPSGEYEASVDDPLVGNAISATNAAASEVSKLGTAAAQGRGSTDAVDIKTELMFRRLFKQFPGYEGHIMDTAKKWGVDSPLFAEYKRAEDSITAEQQFMQKDEDDAITTATHSLGLDPNKYSRQQLVNLGRQQNKTVAELNLTTQRLNNTQTQRSLSRDDYNFTRARASEDTYQQGLNLIGPQLTAAVQNIAKLTSDPSVPDAMKEQGLSQAISAVNTDGQLKIKNFLSTYGGNMTPEARGEWEKNANDYLKMTTDMLTGPLSSVQSSQRTLTQMTTQMNLDVRHALPLYTQMKEAFGSQTVNEQFFNSIMSDPKTKDALSKELKGFNGLSQPETTARVNNMISILRGETGLHDYSPAESRQMLPHLVGTMQGLVSQGQVAQGKDVDAHHTAVVAVGAVSNAAVDAVGQWGVKDLRSAAVILTDQRVINTLSAPVNKDAVDNVKGVYMPALQKVHEALKDTPTGDPYFKVEFSNGHYVPVRTAAPTRQTTTGMGVSGAYEVTGTIMAGQKPDPNTVRKIEGLNKTLDTLVSQSAKGWDKAVPANLTDPERRRLYANGTIPENMRGEGKANPVKTWQENIEALKSQSRANIASDNFVPGAVGNISSVEGTGSDPNSSAVGGFINSTWLHLMKTHRSDLTEGKSDADILSMRKDPAVREEMIHANAAENSHTLSQNKLPVTPGNLNMMHMFGPGEGPKVLAANSDTPIEDLVSNKTLAANPWLKGKTVAEVRKIRKADA